MSLQGRVIEYIDQGRFYCALVIEDTGKRLRLVNQNGREVVLPHSRVLHQSAKAYSSNASRQEQLDRLQELHAKRQELMAEVNLEEVWLLASEEEGMEFELRFLAELSFGKDVTDDHVAAFLRCVFQDKFFFKYRSGKIAAHTPEVVEQLRQRLEDEKAQEEFLENSARGFAALWQGNSPDHWPERERSLKLIRDFYVFNREAPESAMARDLLKKAGITGPHDPFHLLVKAGVWDRNENIPLLRYEVAREFSEAALSQAAAIKEADYETLLAAGRRDLTDLALITIDGPETRDHDDALHVERRGDTFVAGVHIADVGYYIQPGSPLFDEARQRITSMYFPDATIPMLPKELSEDVCSLIKGRIRPALSLMIRLDQRGKVLEFDLIPSIVKVARQLTYNAIGELAETDNDLRTLLMLSQRLRQRRIEASALILPIPELHIDCKSGDDIRITVNDADTPARLLVAEFMILANTIGAEYVADRGGPGLFRGQAEPNKRLTFVPEKDLYINFRQRKYLSPGVLTTQPKPHSGIGALYYTTMTSPIRRFLDLAMQIQASSMARGKGIVFSEEQMKDLVAAISSGQTKANLVRQLRHRYWIIKHLEKKVNERVTGIILTKGPKRVQVLLPDFLQEVDLPPSQAVRAQPGDTVSLKIAKANALENELRLEW